jgi:regulator of protease activity HflC (stomatin/prohibitin superfamily)
MQEGAVPVSLIIASMPVQYRVKDLYSYIYNHNEPKQLLESICYRELTKFAASARIEVDNESDMSQSLLGAGRAEAERVFKDKIQAAADEEKLGIEIVFLGLQGLHPPPEVAADYQKVVGAVQTKEAMILYADANSNITLSTLTGSVKEADELYNLAAQYQLAKEQNDSQKMEKLAKDLDAAFAQASGDIFSTLRQAQSYAFERTTVAKATGQRFADQLKAYRAGKEIYKRQQRLAAMEEALANTRKYVVVAGQKDKQVTIVDLQEKLTPGLYDITGIGENK